MPPMAVCSAPVRTILSSKSLWWLMSCLNLVLLLPEQPNRIWISRESRNISVYYSRNRCNLHGFCFYSNCVICTECHIHEYYINIFASRKLQTLHLILAVFKGVTLKDITFCAKFSKLLLKILLYGTLDRSGPIPEYPNCWATQSK